MSIPARPPRYPIHNFLVAPQSSAKKYWKPRRPIRPGDFQMDEDRLFNSLDCLGPPFLVDMENITHSGIPATLTDIRVMYGGKLGLTFKIAPEKIASHGFDHWMVPNMDFHPFLPAQPGWPGLMLRSDDELEEWEPEEGTEFRVVMKRDPQFLEYVGQYEMVRLNDITTDEWKEQPAKVFTQTLLELIKMFNGSSKVKKRWAQVIGGGRSGNDVIARVALRKRLGKEPTIEDLTEFTSKLSPDDYITLTKDHTDEVDAAFRKGEEVRIECFPQAQV